jgi:flagellar motor switch protein FliN/FliY
MSPQAATKVDLYFAAWVGSLASLLSRLTSSTWQVEAAPGQDYSPLACVRVTCDGGLRGGQSLQFSPADIAQLLGFFLGEEISPPAELDDMQREALEELVRQWAGLAAGALKPDFGEVTLQAAIGPTGSVAGAPSQLLRVSDGARAIAVQMAADEVLTAALAEPAGASPAPPSARPPATPDTSSQIEELLRQGNLALLMDVELGVTLRFGCRQATLHEVLDLATGAVLELDREIQEPVDLLLNGRVIARGEVVVVDGNYGLRVTEVASPQQRVNSL